jgi:hypothetical protein
LFVQLMQQFILPVLVWSPIEQFPKVKFGCPKCAESQNCLSPITWTNGRVHQPRLIHGVFTNILLFSRVYGCQNCHEVYGHHPGLVENNEITSCNVPFLLWHNTGYTLSFMDHLEHMVCSGVSMQECEMNFKQNRVVSFYRIHRKLALSFREEVESIPSVDSMPVWKDSPTRHSISSLFLYNFWNNEQLYNLQMEAGTVPSDGLWLSCDHTFKSVANIGTVRSADGRWVEQYSGLFCVLNSEGQVLTWKLTKDLKFSSIEKQLDHLQHRLLSQGKHVTEFYIDNCCSWRCKLKKVFGSDIKVMLDIFHAIQRITTKMSKRHAFHSQCVHDLKMAFRDPSDRGIKRTKATPSSAILCHSLNAFVLKWKAVEYDGMKVLPPAALQEVNCILRHVDRGCLSCILPGRGTNRNERLHRELNKIVHNTRYGVELGYALITCMFFHHNEKIRAAREVRTAKPIAAYVCNHEFERVKEKFGLDTARCAGGKNNDDTTLQSLPLKDLPFHSVIERIENMEVDSEETEESAEWILAQDNALSLLKESVAHYYIFQYLSNLSKTATIDPNSFFFASFLSMTDRMADTTPHQDPTNQQLQSVLNQWNFKQIPVPSDGNCLFTAVSLSILQRNDQVLFNRLGIGKNSDVSSLSEILRRLVVEEWLGEHLDYYQKFVTIDIQNCAEQYLDSGEFAGDLGDLMVLTIANILHLPITIFTNMPNLSVICISPVSGITSTEPIFLTFDSSGPGHYSYAIPIPSTESDAPSVQSSLGTKCYCGRKKECSGSACLADMLGNCRCPCAKKERCCTTSCRCSNCCNKYGTRTVQSRRQRASYSTQKQPLSGRKGKDFLKVVNEDESLGKTTEFERFLIAAMLIHFIVNGIEVSPENVHKAYSDINRLVQSFAYVEFPLFKRSIQFFSRYLSRFNKLIQLFMLANGTF